MLRLVEITIRNLRSIRRETFPLSDYTPLIGYNNAGKTNILSGCRWLLTRNCLAANHFNDPRAAVEVEGLFEGVTVDLLTRLDPEHAEALKPWLRGHRLRVMRRQSRPGDDPSLVEFYALDPGDPGRSDDFPHNGTSRAWRAEPKGLEHAVMRLFPAPILVSESALGGGNGQKVNDIVGKLIAEIIEPLERRYAGAVEEAFSQLHGLLDPDSETRAPELAEFDRMATAKVEPLFPSLRLQLHIPTPDPRELFKKGTLRVQEEGEPEPRELDSLGAGTRRSIQMALLRQLAEVRKHHRIADTRTLLLIDSPELYLHPQAIELVRVALRNLSREGYQVVFATHSAQMVTSEDMGSCVLVRKDQERGTYMRRRMEDAIRAVVEDAPSQLQMLFSLSNSNELLFADNVLLSEGKTELRLLPVLFEKVTGESLALFKCALVRQGGVSNTRKSMAVLDAMDLPARAIVDLDYAFTGAQHDGFLDLRDPDIEHCKILFHRMSHHERIRLVNGIPVNRHSSMTASDAYAMLAAQSDARPSLERIHRKLLQQGIWVWTWGSIENHLGLDGKNEHVWANFIDRLRRQALEKVVRDPEGIRRLTRWIMDGARK